MTFFFVLNSVDDVIDAAQGARNADIDLVVVVKFLQLLLSYLSI